MTVKEKVRAFLEEHPKAGRYTLMEVFGLKEHTARQLLTEIRSEPEWSIDLLNIGIFDLESTNLPGDLGRLICGSVYSWPKGEMTTFRNDEIGPNMADDKGVCVAMRDKLMEHDITVGWYSKGFDITFLNTRLLQHNEKLLPTSLHLDPIWYFKGWRGIKTRSAKLAVVAEFFDLEERKMGVDVGVWVRAGAGSKEDIDILCERCESDVRVTAEITAAAFKAGIIKNIQRYP